MLIALFGVADYLIPPIYGLAMTLPLIGYGIFAVIHNYREMHQ